MSARRSRDPDAAAADSATSPRPEAVLAAGLDGPDRREFLRLLGGGVALLGLGACGAPPEHILPYVAKAPELTPGVSQWYATSMEIGGASAGLLVESRDGRPIKVEGNPEHPASLGATDAYAQALVRGLYDPDRAGEVRFRGEPSSWPALDEALSGALAASAASGGERLALLLEPTASPLALEMLARFRERFPAAAVHFHSPLAPVGAREGARLAFGRPLDPVLDPGAADVVVSLDADFLAGGTYPVRYARTFAERRRADGAAGSMSRLYVAEGMLTPTGGLADHRLRVRSGDVHALAAALLEAVLERGAAPTTAGAAGAEGLDALRRASVRLDDGARAWVRLAARDLAASPGRALVVVGARQPAPVHALGHYLNALLGSHGTTLRMIEPPVVDGAPGSGLVELVAAMEAGAVERLLVLGGNPSYSAPADLRFGERLAALPWTLHLGLHHDETSGDCVWSAPLAHTLESWGDGRAFDGTVTFVQPLVRPLLGGRSVVETLARLAGVETADGHALLADHWLTRLAGGAAGDGWERALALGFLRDTAASPVAAAPAWEALTRAAAAGAAAAPARATAGLSAPLELSLVLDASVLDGRFANNPWLQELPDPITKLTWDNAALMSAATATAFDVETGDVVRLRHAGYEVDAPVLVAPGHADGSVSLALGYGRRAPSERAAEGVGADAYRLRTTAAPWFAEGLEIEPLGARHELARTQRHDRMEGRPIVFTATAADYRADPDFTAAHRGPQPSLYRPFDAGPDDGPQWTMSIDLALCTGCSACMVACQAENNVPVVGREGVLDGREMHWLRIDRYFEGPLDDPAVLVQPMLCQHCEKAPCEYVCPVNATVHSPDGLNEMVYNRCVGTRFCSNNCPYKVRRFNWFDYHDDVPEILRLAMNPDVTVRDRGVMEKCTFCVQRIRRAEIRAGAEGRPLAADEVRTACQQACPTRAIVFGSKTAAGPELRARLEAPRRYALLHDLGTRPRVEYLARITNPAPPLDDA